MFSLFLSSIFIYFFSLKLLSAASLVGSGGGGVTGVFLYVYMYMEIPTWGIAWCLITTMRRLRAPSFLFPHHHPYPQYQAGAAQPFPTGLVSKRGHPLRRLPQKRKSNSFPGNKQPGGIVGRFIQSAGLHFYFYWRRYPLPFRKRHKGGTRSLLVVVLKNPGALGFCSQCSG